MSSESPPRGQVPAFTPVPVRRRADGWTPGRQADFLGHLAARLSVTEAAGRVGMSRESAYRLRGRKGAESFAAAWDGIASALPKREPSVHELLWDRAVRGVLKPVMRGGREVATIHSYDNNALLRLLRRTSRSRRLRSERERSR